MPMYDNLIPGEGRGFGGSVQTTVCTINAALLGESVRTTGRTI